MASPITHPVLALALGTAFHRRLQPASFWLAVVGLSEAPDLDTITHNLGVPYAAGFGHRGASHSLLAAALLAWLASLCGARWWRAAGIGRVRAFICFFLAAASHGMLDAATDGGLGVAFLWPLSLERWFLPWRPIAVSPLSIEDFLGRRGLHVLATEFLWVWLPSGVLAALCLGLGRGRSAEPPRSAVVS